MKKFFRSTTFTYITITVALIGHLASYLQAYKIFLLKSSFAVSLPAAFISLISIIVWFIYGTTHHVKPLIYANIFGFVGIILVILGIFVFSG